MAKKMKVNEGDWICADKDCGNVNFSWREKCNKCGKDKGKVDTYKKTGSEIGKQAASKSGGLFSADDWQCAMCGNVNWARRNECNMCKQPKFAKVEARTGVGGGYCERDNVEYIDRGDSDDEIDEFGRKKKQFRLNRNGSSSNKTESDEEATGRDEEDDDDDEDDDVDLSKYDLAASDEEIASTDNRKDIKSSRSHDWSRRRSRSRSRDRKSRRSRSRSRDRHRSRSGERRRRHDSDRRERRSRSPERRRRSYRSRS